MNLVVSGVYTSQTQCFAREILAIENREVTYRDFVIHDGRPMSARRKCAVGTFRNWVFRPCTESEAAGLRRDLISADDERQAVLMQSVLDAVKVFQQQSLLA